MTQARSVTLHFTDGEMRKLVISAGESILDAGLAAGLPLLYQCRSGSCGACVATLLEGDTRNRTGRGSNLLPAEVARGQRLLCQSEADSNCTFSLAYASDAGQIVPTRVHAFVNGIEWLAQDVVRLTLELAEDDWLEFKPGQYLRLNVPGSETWRAYSPSSTAQTLPRLEFLVRLIDGGVMSTWISRDCRVDDVLELEGPFGQFFLREPCRAPHVFIAGGTGLAPVLAMLGAIRRQGGVKPPLLVSFGCRSESSLFGVVELELFSQWLPRLSVRVSIEQGMHSTPNLGTPLTALSAEDFIHPQVVVYVCGPPPMVEAAQVLLSAWGVSPTRIYSEQFSPSNDPAEVS
jgi:benzoate/toluate 1,2-dioxygenase reductase subunit